MAWNEPGGGNRDPWGSRGNQGPPDIDEVFKKLQENFSRLFGRRGGGGGGGGAGGGGRGGAIGVGLIAAVLLVIWLASGIYIVDPAERGVVLRFGRHVDTTVPGPHWHLPFPIERVEKVDVDQVRTARHKAEMLTQDENIVQVELASQYKVRDAGEFLFQVRIPEETLKDAVESAIREIVGKSKMDFILTEGRAELVAQTQELTQSIIDRYQTGLIITKINLQDAQPPEDVQDAFADAIKAREDKQRVINEAEAYANEVIPQARGDATAVLKQAEAYRSEVIARAEGDTARFVQLLTEYRKAPDVTRERLYIDAVETVLAASSKVMVDVQGGNNLFYLPLDRMIRSAEAGPDNAMPTGTRPPGAQFDTPTDTRPARVFQRGREVRR
jgi:membrane protease subunit HflK